MEHIKSSTTDISARNNASWIANDLKAAKFITFTRVGDFYEIYGSKVTEVAKILDIAVTQKAMDNEQISMTGFPIATSQKYAQILNANGYFVNISENAKAKDDEQLTDIKSDSTSEIIDEQPEQAEDYSEYIGKEITVDDHKFVVDNINADFGNVSLRDISFQNSTGFPIFRSESIEWLKNIIQEQPQEQTQKQTQKQTELPPPIITKPTPVQNQVIYPEIPVSERHNFVITDNELGYGTPSEKYAANIAAIQTLKQVESEHRLADKKEQETLSRYVGWGGLANYFEETHPKYNELKSLLTDDEYEQARSSVLTSHFTPPVVIRSMYKALENMGFQNGNILEPS